MARESSQQKERNMSHRITFSEENKAKTTNYDFPKLKLEKDEVARVLLIEPEPAAEYVYTLRAPVLEDGVPVYEERESRKGEKYTTLKMRFVSRPIALGDFNKLQDGDLDAKNDILGAYATKYPDRLQAPQRRFATNIIRYKTAKKGSNEIQRPFSVDLLVWSFTDKVFSKLVDFTREWGGEEQNLRNHDLILGPCTNPLYQQFDISVASKAAWREDPEYQKLVVETYKNNRIDDLSVACGQKKEERFIQMDLDEVTEAWEQVRAYENRQKGIDVFDTKTEDTSLSEDLGSLLDDSGHVDADKAFPKSEAPKSSSVASGNADDLLDGLLDSEPSEDEGTTESKKSADIVEDFDSLLEGL